MQRVQGTHYIELIVHYKSVTLGCDGLKFIVSIGFGATIVRVKRFVL